MPHNLLFTTPETVLLAANGLVCFGMLFYCYTRRDPREFWSPLLFVAAIYVYYVILGPGISVAFGWTMNRATEMRPYYVHAWGGALVALLSWLAGYAAKGAGSWRRQPMEIFTVNPQHLWRAGIGLCLSGIGCFLLTSGLGAWRMLNPLAGLNEPTGFAYDGAFANYFRLAANFLIPGVALLFLLRLRGHGRWWVVAVFSCAAMGIYTNLGFRYRLVLLAGGLTFIYYMHRRQRPNLVLFSVAATVFIAAMGFIGEHRQYGSGLALTDDTSGSIGESLLSGFGETQVFGTSGAVLAMVPSQHPLAWGQPIIQTVLMPLPSSLFPTKDSAGYLTDMLIAIYGPVGYQGAAYMAFAEWYLAFWWPGLILYHFFLGWTSRWVWNWYRQRAWRPVALVVYAAAIPYLYVVFSRGYLPQVAMLFVYTVLPAVALYRWMPLGSGREFPADPTGPGESDGADPAGFPPSRILRPGMRPYLPEREP